MPNPGNAWHLPGSPEPRGRSGMRLPFGAVVAGTAVRIVTGNQFQGGGNAGNQLQAGSGVLFRRGGETTWTALPLTFESTVGNNKYFGAVMPADTFVTGDQVEYYCRIAYDDHDTTFLHGTDATSATTTDEEAARSAPFGFTVEDGVSKGRWGPVFPLRNVAAHACLLRTGRVLIWGRRDQPDQSLDEHECTPFLWDPVTQEQVATPQPRRADGTTVNLFCAGHAFLPDGRLLVVGGHNVDGDGLDQAAVYDPDGNTWTATERMQHGRWYPTATAMPDGSVLVLSGSYRSGGQIVNNTETQVWRDGTWSTLATIPVEGALDLYPRVHVGPTGIAFMAGPRVRTWTLDVAAGGSWSRSQARANGARDYAPSVLVDDVLLYLGGGNDVAGRLPTAATETLDVAATPLGWQPGQPMRSRRRQHNATILADGTVLVTGGTRGGGGTEANSQGFNDLRAGQPVHVAELWDPTTGAWTELAAEQVDRCYHATAVLLPDATVLSAGGGEYKPDGNVPNAPEDTHRDAQVFFPPYLFKGPRPEITAAPTSVSYGSTFTVGTAQAEEIAKVTWIGLSSVTHSFNMGQRINVLPFASSQGELEVTAPTGPQACPPGHYLLFVVDGHGVPSVARVVRIAAAVGVGAIAGLAEAAALATAAADPETAAAGPAPDVAYADAYEDAFLRRDRVREMATGRPVVVGITATCPYGLGACWGSASEALETLEGVQHVDPVPDAGDSTATVFLGDDQLPRLDLWREQFQRVVNATYDLRGVEVTLDGTVTTAGDQLLLNGRTDRSPVQLSPLEAADKVQWDHAGRAPRAVQPDEAAAYLRLSADAAAGGDRRVTVTGPLEATGSGYRLKVRVYSPSA